MEVENRAIFVLLDDGTGNPIEVGFVMAKDGASYSNIRDEIANDELEGIKGHSFVFLAERKLPLSRKQEDKYKVIGNEVILKLVDGGSNQHGEGNYNQHVKRQRVIIEELEEETNLNVDVTVDVAEVTINAPLAIKEGSTLVEDRLQSKLATRAEINKWKKDLKYYTKKMRDTGRLDLFEIMSLDVNGKAVFSIWCIECNMQYGKSGREDSWYNFTAKHCMTKAHEEKYHQNHKELPATNEVEAQEDIAAKNKALVEQCLIAEVAPFVDQSGVLFELFEDSVAGYKTLGSICIVCKLCSKSLLLFPCAGSIVGNMKQHIMSFRHIKNVEAKEKNEKNNKGGRPKNPTDPRQRSMLNFINRATSSGVDKENLSDMTRDKLLASLCWGYWQMRYKYGTKSRDLRPFLDDARAGHKWYCEPKLQGRFEKNGKVVVIDGTFRHVSCTRVTQDRKQFMNYQCSLCAIIPKERDLRMRVYRYYLGKKIRGLRSTDTRITVDYLTNRELHNMARGTRLKNRKLRMELKFIKMRVVALSVKSRSLPESLNESLNRKDVRKFCRDITEAHSIGKFNGRQALWDFLTDIAQNVLRPGRGKRYKRTTKELFETIKIWGGRRMHNFLSLNLAGPSLSTTMRSTRESFVYRVGIREDTFIHLAKTYAKHMKELGLALGHVPCTVAEDETVVKRVIHWVARDDSLVGFCGKLEDHSCDASFVVNVGNDGSGYENIVQAFTTNVIAHYARVLIVNPLHACLPKLVLAIQLTCNKFDHVFVRGQWEEILKLWDLHLRPILGLLIGHSSDGDARRRACMLQDYTSLKGASGCFRIPWEGWVLSATIRRDGSVYGLHDQDFIHNGKKLINPLDNAARRLYLGDELVTLNDVWHVFSLCQGEHGLEIGDVERKDRQNWRSAQRIASRKVQVCLKKLRNGTNGPQIRTLGTETYLSIVALYIDIFLSPHMNLRARVKAAATVSLFFRLWRLWILKHETHTLSKNFISRETFMDVQVSCHFVVLLVKFFKENCKELPIPLHCTGSDACENFFSKVGGMIRNERSYTGGDLLESASALNKVAEFQALSDLVFPSAHAKQESIWQLLERQIGEDGLEIHCDLSDYTLVNTDAIIKEALEEGFLHAKELCQQVGISCNGSEDVTWWNTPWLVEDYFHQDYYKQLQDDQLDDESDMVEISHEDVPIISQEASNNRNEDIIAESKMRHVFDKMVDERELKKDIKIERTVKIDDKEICKATLVSQLNGNPWLSKDRLTRVKNQVQCTNDNKKVNAATSLGIGSDCAIYFEVEQDCSTRKRKHAAAATPLQQTKHMWYLGRVLSMRKRVGKGWRENREPIDLTDRPSYLVQVNLAWYKEHKQGTNLWFSYDLTDLQLISLESIISLACMTYDPKTSRYSLDENDRHQFNMFLSSQFKGNKGKEKAI